MNIKALHSEEKSVSAKHLFQGEKGSSTAIHLSKGGQLSEHITKTPALLLCVKGKAVFGNEEGIEEHLIPGDYVMIEPLIRHWVDSNEGCELILLK